MTKMAVQQFCLRWNNHQPNFISVFADLLNSEALVDVTLAAEGKQLQAHKVVLSACSTYFQTLFTTTPCQHPIVILKDIKYNDLKTMVDFMYYGEVNVSQDQLPAILKTAETLKVKGLAEMPEGMSLSKSDSQGSESPWSLRRKRLRKSSTGSSEQTSTENDAAGSVGSGGTMGATPSPLIKQETGESDHHPPPPTRDPSTESDTARSHSFDTDDQTPNTPARQLSEDHSDTSNIKWSSSTEEPKTSLIQQLPGWEGPLEWEQTSWEPEPGGSKRKRVANPQAEENFIAALDAVRSGRLGFCKAAKVYGVNNRTLWLEYKRRGLPLVRPSTKVKSQQISNYGKDLRLPPPTPIQNGSQPCSPKLSDQQTQPEDLVHTELHSEQPHSERQPPHPTTPTPHHHLQSPPFHPPPFINRFQQKYDESAVNIPPYYLYNTL